MKILPLTTIFSNKFFKKTKSVLTDDDVSRILRAYVEEHRTLAEISNVYNTHRKNIAKILKACLSEEEFKRSKSECYSTSVNQKDRKLRQVKTWKERNTNWIPPLARSKKAIDKMLLTRSANYNYKPEKNFGSSQGTKNGRYIKIADCQLEEIKKLISENLSINAIEHLVGLDRGKITRTILEQNVMTREELSKYLRKKRQSFPEWKFEQMLISSGIDYTAQFSISFQDNLKKRRRVYDFYIASHNLLIELDGKAWHDVAWCKSQNICEKHISKIQNAKENDLFKEKLASLNGLIVKRISDFSDSELQSVILSLS